MSISLWDPFRTSPSVAPFYPRRSLFMDPFEQLERSMNQLDQFFDQSMNVQLRDHAAQLNIDKDSGQLSYKVDTSGFRPEELKVDLEGNQLTVRGEHREENEGETVHRQFVRSVVIPEGIQRESIKCDLDNQGRLCIIGVRNQQPTRSIPIDFKQQQQQAQIGQQQPQDQQKLR